MHEVLYRFHFSPSASTGADLSLKSYTSLLNVAQLPSSSLWHNRLGHPCNTVLACVLKACDIFFKQSDLQQVCTACQLGKAHKLHFPATHTVYSLPFELVVSNVWGPAHLSSNGFSYYVSFIDVYSRYTGIYFLKTKSEMAQCFLNFHQMVKV